MYVDGREKARSETGPPRAGEARNRDGGDMVAYRINGGLSGEKRVSGIQLFRFVAALSIAESRLIWGFDRLPT